MQASEFSDFTFILRASRMASMRHVSNSFPDIEASCHSGVYNALAYFAPRMLRTMVWSAIDPLTAKETKVGTVDEGKCWRG